MKKIILALIVFLTVVSYSKENKYFHYKFDQEGWLPQMTNKGGIIGISIENSPEIELKRVGQGSGIYRYTMSPEEGQRLEFSRSNGKISIENLYLNVINGRKDNETYIVTTSTNGKVYLNFLGTLYVRRDNALGGIYTSNPIRIKIEDTRYNDSDEYINLYFKVLIEKTISLKVVNMSLGKGIRGERLSSDKGDGRPGILYIEGTPNEEVEISYPKVVYLDRVGGGDSKMKVHITNSTHQNNGEIELDLDYYGTAEVKFNGTTENTSKLQGGQYRGQMQIDVRYD